MNNQDKERVAQQMLFFLEPQSPLRGVVAFVMDKLDDSAVLLAPESLTRCDCGCDVLHGPVIDTTAPEGSQAQGDGNWGTASDLQVTFANLMFRAGLAASERSYVIQAMHKRIKWGLN